MAKEVHRGVCVSPEHRKLREDLAACYRLLAHYRMTDLTYTHCTLRVPGPERRYLINPYGLMWGSFSVRSVTWARPRKSACVAAALGRFWAKASVRACLWLR